MFEQKPVTEIYTYVIVKYSVLGGPGLAVQLSIWGIDKNLCSD